MKAIKGRIGSVKNTKKITKAMEMVSAAKMRKAVDTALNTRLYARLAVELMERLSELQEPNFPLLERRPVHKILMVIVSSNRGLCGSFNANIIKMGTRLLEEKRNLAKHRDSHADAPEPATDIEVDVLGIGRKSAAFAKKNNLNLLAVFDNLNERPDVDEVLPISKMIIDAFSEKKYDKVVVVYTHFESSLSQVVKVRQLLPISDTDIQKMIEGMPEKNGDAISEDPYPIDVYYLEPSREVILNTVLPRLVEIQLYEALLESAASEHSARMVVMKAASESAGEMITNLTLEFNKARQAAITQEIAEIAGGAAALE